MSIKTGVRRRLKESRIASRQAGGAALYADVPFGHDEAADLERRLLGDVVFPWDPDYDADRQESNPAFQRYPLVIVYCEVENDVRLCLAFARRFGLWVAARSGGHSTAGYSVNNGGMVIDTSRIKYVHVDKETMTAVVGAGTNFGFLNAKLDEHQVHVPGGACEDVCVAGYMQGGGFGYTSRNFGMNCDNVLSFRMMLRDGGIVRADPNLNADLYWAVRGGTGGNFGILLEITYRVHPLASLWGFALSWSIADAPAALLRTQTGYTKTGASPKLGFMGNICTHDGVPLYVLQGMYVGDRESGLAELQPLREIGKPELSVDITLPYGQLDTYLDNHPYPIPQLPPGEVKEVKQAGYIADPMTLDDWRRVVDYYTAEKPPQAANTVVTEGYGGAINARPRFYNAFIHRDVCMDFFVDAFWVGDDGQADAVAWLDGYMKVMQPYFNGHVYQNYPRDTLTEYRWNYWGEAFPTLLAVKNKYDPPPYFFHYQQSIKPYGEGERAPECPEHGFLSEALRSPVVYER